MKIIKKAVPFLIAGGVLFGSVALAGSDPELFKLSKYKGAVGEKVTIKGKNFGGDRGKVMFDDFTRAPILKWSKKRIVISVPDVAVTKTHKVRVCKRGDDCTRSQKFFVKRTGPELWRIKNLSDGNNYQGVPGDRLKITGQNFKPGSISVKFGDVSGNITKRTSRVIYVTVPDLARNKTYQIFVTDGTHNSNSQDFFIKP